jgi:hypothetical protein
VPKPRPWRVPRALTIYAQNRSLAAQQRPTELERAFFKEALGRRKTRTYAKAIRAAGLYGISRDIHPSPQHQERVRLQDVTSHDWRKAWMAQRYSASYGIGVTEDTHKSDIGDIMDAMP